MPDSDDRLGELLVSDPGDRAQMRARYERDGYLFFRSVLDLGQVYNVKADLQRVLEHQGLIAPGADEPLWSGAPYEQIDDRALYGLESYIELFATASMRRLLEAVFGEPGFTARCVTIRFALPGDAAHVSAAHQDGHYVPGIDQLRTLWVPLMAIDRAVAPLALAAGSHRRGLLPHVTQPHLESYVLKGRKQSGIDWRGLGFDWQTADFAPGDVLIFDRRTVHRSLPNSSERIRLSLDTRCHPASVPASFQNRHTILELRDYRESALAIAAELEIGQSAFEALILEMMRRGVPAERRTMAALWAELAD